MNHEVTFTNGHNRAFIISLMTDRSKIVIIMQFNIICKTFSTVKQQYLLFYMYAY